MNKRLNTLFGPYLRLDSVGGLTAQDGRALDRDAPAFLIAGRLIDDEPQRYADEIIKLMKPFCTRFDATELRSRILELAPTVSKRKGRRLTDEMPASAQMH
jgi:hypothetical protein